MRILFQYILVIYPSVSLFCQLWTGYIRTKYLKSDKSESQTMLRTIGAAGAINIAQLAAEQIKSSFDKLPTFVISPSASLPNSSWSHWILVQICWLHNICSKKGSKQSNCLAAQNQQNLSLSGFETNPQTYLTKILSPRPCSIFWSQYSPLAHPCPKGSYNGLKHRGWLEAAKKWLRQGV